jgi:hypothetical protein
VSSLLPGAGRPTHSAPVAVSGQTMRGTARPVRPRLSLCVTSGAAVVARRSRSVALTGTIGARATVNDLDDFGVVDPLEVDGVVDPLEVDRPLTRLLWPSWRWMTIRARLVRHLDRRARDELMRSESTRHARCGWPYPHLGTGAQVLPVPGPQAKEP